MRLNTSWLQPVGPWGWPIGLLAILVILAACQTQPNQIFIEVDGGRQAITTETKTVREALTQAQVELGALDRVTPDLYTQLEPGLVIKVIRVEEKIETKREVIPFQRQTITNEALASGETRISQLGVNGQEEISIRVLYENEVEVNRTEVSRVIVVEPVPEILVVGSQTELPSTPIEGTITYLANGNAWLMRNSSGSRRPLTQAGDLDGRVFSLSADGRYLLYTRAITKQVDLPLNELWLASTAIVGEAPITVGVQGLLYAEWSPVLSQSLIAYSTAERSLNPPGWRANNDLWLFVPPQVESTAATPAGLSTKPLQLLPANTQGLYPWWGTTFAWSPDGTRLAYARADQIGVIDLTFGDSISATTRPIVDFTPLKTFSEWVWLPGISWSPDGQFIVAVVHGPPLAAEPAEESQVFDLWLFGVNREVAAKVAQQVGMWSNPVWGQNGIMFGQAVNPLQSVNSRYFINMIDRDGSNQRQLFPFQQELGVQLPELTWLPNSPNLLFIYNGNLYTMSSNGTPPKQLTTDGQANHPRWAGAAPVITNNVTPTGTVTITTTGVATPTPAVGTKTPITPTPAITYTRRSTSTPALVVTPNSVTTSLTSTEAITPTNGITTPVNANRAKEQ